MNTPTPYSLLTPALLASSLFLLSACSSSDDDPVSDTTDAQTQTSPDSDVTDTPPSEDAETQTPPISSNSSTDYGYAFTRGPAFDSGQIERINLTTGNTIDGTYPGTESDHRVATDGQSVYQLGRFTIDNLTRFSATDTSVVDYQISVLNEDVETFNPQAIAFVNDDLAYLTLRGSDKVLVLDPSPEEATTESLITGEISLADYNKGGGDTLDLPDMTNAIIVDDKLFVLMENLDNFAPINGGYIAVIDTNTNLEIPTQQGEFPRQGIDLQTVNPTSLHFNTTTGLIYVTGRGNYFLSESAPGDPYTGGIETINPTTFETALLIDDGTEDNNVGFFLDTIVINETLGYLITLDGFNADFSAINNLRTFNPTSGEISEPIAGTEGQSLTTLAVGLDNHLWVGIQSLTPGFMRIDLATGEIAPERVATNLIPSNIVFIDVEN
ncbi:MAG: hypothetical protein AB8B97_21390 [Granulosicoccus sp.]